MNKNGNSTRNHEMLENPDVHIKFKMNVQKMIYITLAININEILFEGQLKLPKQYLS